MKKVLLTLFAAIVVLGLFAAIGYAGYRVGYAQGTQITADGQAPGLRPFDEWGLRRMPMHDFGFERGLPRGFGMRGGLGLGFGFFSLLGLLTRLAVLALIIGVVYWLLTRSGWRLTRTVQVHETSPGSPESEVKE